MSTRSPDYDLTFLDKTTSEKGRIGAGWDNDDGSISIVLNPCVVIQSRKDFNIRLFKRDHAFDGPKQKSPYPKPASPDDRKDDCPF